MERPRHNGHSSPLLRVALAAAVFLVLGVIGFVAFAKPGGDGKAKTQTPAAKANSADSAATSTKASAPKAKSAAEGAQLAAIAAAQRQRVVAKWPVSGTEARAKKVPILMYHLVATPKAQTPNSGLWVPTALFKSQVAALKSAGFTAVTMTEMWAAWQGKGRLPQKPVVLSFDDGDLTHVTNVAPILKAAGWPGVLNLATNHLNNKGLPKWGAKRLLKYGWELGSHTINHLDLTGLSTTQLAHELSGSRTAIRKRLGVNPEFFCYPAGRNNAVVRAAVKRSRYRAATTVDPGIASRSQDPMLLPRVRVEPTTTPSGLVSLASGATASPAPSAAAEY